MEMAVVAVIGSKSSGKTTTIEVLTKGLTKRGYKVGAVKHISELDFTIDTEGKDTWRFAQSGAKTIVSAASGETAIIEKSDQSHFSLEEILRKCKDNDVVFLEGFKNLVGKNPDIPKIVSVKSSKEALNALRTSEPILAFTGFHSIETLDVDISYMNILKDKDRIVDVVEKYVRKRRKANSQN